MSRRSSREMRRRIRQWGERLFENEGLRDSLTDDQASRLLNELANDLPALTELVGRAAALAPHLRCATPAAEPMIRMEPPVPAQ